MLSGRTEVSSQFTPLGQPCQLEVMFIQPPQEGQTAVQRAMQTQHNNYTVDGYQQHLHRAAANVTLSLRVSTTLHGLM